MAVLADASSFVEPEILELDEETVTEFEKAYEPLRLYDRILKENFRKKEHILSPEMEAVLAKAGDGIQPGSDFLGIFERRPQIPAGHG